MVVHWIRIICRHRRYSGNTKQCAHTGCRFTSRQAYSTRSAAHTTAPLLTGLPESLERLAQLNAQPASDIAWDRDMVAQAQAGQLL